MTIGTARQIVLAARPKGKPQLTDFRLEETAIPTPRSEQVLLEVQYLSLDPYMRGRMDDGKSYAKPLQLGDVMVGETVAKVIASKHPRYSEGDIVLAHTGWRTHALSDGAGLSKVDPALAPVSTRLGVLGMPGFTAYCGMRVIGKPKAGETVAVAAASGPVGSLVGQLAKLAGARAVGIAGGPEKCDFVRNELRFDAAVDHRAADFPAQLAAACPKCRRSYLAGGVAAAQQLRAGAGLRPHRAVQWAASRRRHGSAACDHAPDSEQEPDIARIHLLRIC